MKKVTAWFEKVLLSCFGRVKWAVGHALRLTSLRDEWRRMTYPTAHLTDIWSRKVDIYGQAWLRALAGQGVPKGMCFVALVQMS
ncbi:MAG: hypothetical protein B7Y59_10780 [Burkholderiales bacterium 35-55-47]|uniref:hypothetical protein n=1 Tax=Limnohabitans sp. TaxID=1907725 RepID=UPI000BDA6BBA|nr:hypothetical protein [Limnohabitans sp.]OYY17789.1 MAG: hypothetical protein B7Y59_10780 [Burkholderiales bacterium 35-55-47]